MKKLIFWLVLLAAVGGLVYLVQAGIIKWQPLTILVAALAAPLKFIAGLFGDSEEEIRKRHAAAREEEARFQEELESRIAARERRITALRKEIEAIDVQLESLAKRREQVAAEIEKMSVEEKQRLGQQLLGE